MGTMIGRTDRHLPVGVSTFLNIAVVAVVLTSVSELRADHAHAEHSHAHDQIRNTDSAQHAPLYRARNLQREHRFSESALVLANFLEENPWHAEGQLLHADVLRHDGRLDEARRACLRVALAGAQTLAGYCAVQMLLEEGEYERGDSISEQLGAQRDLLGESAKIWALEISAEAAWRAGRTEAARQMFVEATDFDNVPHSTLDAYAEFLEASN